MSKAGVTAPPFHVYCRSTTCPYFDDDFGQIGQRAARDENGKTYYVPDNMTYEEWQKAFVNGDKSGLTNAENGGIIKSGGISGALNPFDDRAIEHAKRYYESVRSMTTDVKRISQNTGFSLDEIQIIKNFIFIEKHDLGEGVVDYFEPSYAMAQSWQRLIDGKNIQPHDITLLKHEMMERTLMQQGYTQDEAHRKTSKIFDYKKESEAYYDKIEKH